MVSTKETVEDEWMDPTLKTSTLDDLDVADTLNIHDNVSLIVGNRYDNNIQR
jgi:hypothetical protein